MTNDKPTKDKTMADTTVEELAKDIYNAGDAATMEEALMMAREELKN